MVSDATNCSPVALMRSLEDSLKTTGLQQDFDLLGSIDANRVVKNQMRIMHKKSRIQCVLLFDRDSSVEKASKILSDYMTLNPICKSILCIC